MILAVIDNEYCEGVCVDITERGASLVQPVLCDPEKGVEWVPVSLLSRDLTMRVLGGTLTTNTYPG